MTKIKTRYCLYWVINMGNLTRGNTKSCGWRDAVTLFETSVKVGNNRTLRGDNY